MAFAACPNLTLKTMTVIVEAKMSAMVTVENRRQLARANLLLRTDEERLPMKKAKSQANGKKNPTMNMTSVKCLPPSMSPLVSLGNLPMLFAYWTEASRLRGTSTNVLVR